MCPGLSLGAALTLPLPVPHGVTSAVSLPERDRSGLPPSHSGTLRGQLLSQRQIIQWEGLAGTLCRGDELVGPDPTVQGERRSGKRELGGGNQPLLLLLLPRLLTKLSSSQHGEAQTALIR